MSSIYQERVLKRLAKLIHKHSVEDHTEASAHAAFAKEFKKREDCWPHVFESAMAYKRDNMDDHDEIAHKSSRKHKNAKKKKSKRHNRTHSTHASIDGKQIFNDAYGDNAQFNESLGAAAANTNTTNDAPTISKKKSSKRVHRKKTRHRRHQSTPVTAEADDVHSPELHDHTPHPPRATGNHNSLSITQRLAKGGMVHGRGEWIKMQDEFGHNYYFNKKTHKSQWESPYQYQKVPPPWTMRQEGGCRYYTNSKTGQELQESKTGTGDVYYYDHKTNESQWQKPWERAVHYPKETKAKEPAQKTTSTIKPSRTGGAGYSSSASCALPSINRRVSRYQS